LKDRSFQLAAAAGKSTCPAKAGGKELLQYTVLTFRVAALLEPHIDAEHNDIEE
jgi:hypothetical protein